MFVTVRALLCRYPVFEVKNRVRPQEKRGFHYMEEHCEMESYNVGSYSLHVHYNITLNLITLQATNRNILVQLTFKNHIHTYFVLVYHKVRLVYTSNLQVGK